MRKRTRAAAAALGILLLVLPLVTSCQSGEGDLLGINFDTEGNEAVLDAYDTSNPVVAIKIEGYGAVVAELYPDIAPNTVNNFISLIKSGFYDGNCFHRSVPGFMIQGGDPDGNGTGGPGYKIKGEFSENGFENNLKHTEGVLSMARSSAYDSAGSQFFIMLGSSPHLDGDYAAFGKVIDGMDVVKRIAAEETVADELTGKLEHNVTIEKMLVDTKGKEYQQPEKIS